MARAWRITVSLAGAVALAAAGPANAPNVRLAASDSADGAQLSLRWPAEVAERPAVRASVSQNVLTIDIDEPIQGEPEMIVAGAPGAVRDATLDPDGKRLRVSLRAAATARVTPAPLGYDVVLARNDAPPAARGAVATLAIGEMERFTRLAFVTRGGATVTPLQSGESLRLRFSKPFDIDVAQLTVTPPRFVRSAQVVSKPGERFAMDLLLEDGVRQRHFVEGDRVVIDLIPGAPAAPPPPEPATAVSANPVPAGGVAQLRVQESQEGTTFSLRWAGPVRAAVFRRGDGVFVLFDANAQIEAPVATRVGRRHQDVRPIRSNSVTGVRISAPPQLVASARVDGATWTVTLSERGPKTPGAVIAAQREQEPAGVRLTAPFGRAGVVRWIEDPAIGDRIAVGLIPGPPLGVAARRGTMEAALLATVHGAAVETRADGVTAAFEDGALQVTRGSGLVASSAIGRGPFEAPPEEGVVPRAGYAMLDLNEWAKAPEQRTMRDMLDELSRRAAAEGAEPGAPTTARIALARFLLASEMAPEALGALRHAAVNQPQLEVDPEFRLMRAAANLMAHRLSDAQRDLSASGLAADATAALWRGYAAAAAENWTEARANLERGRGALPTQPRGWRARFLLALADSALRLNDVSAADAEAAAALAEANSPALRAQAQVLQARIAAARGELNRALQLFDELSRSRDEASAVRAALEAVRLRRQMGQVTPEDAARQLDALRFRWRGDGLELETIQTLALVYSDLGRWRDGLSLMRQAATRFGDHPAARRLRLEMADMFERLFLEGGATQLEPIQALGLFYEFRDLTPYGPDGDRMIRLLAGRLAEMDLLEQAAELLQHQVDHRLEGVGQAQIAADLAALYLTDSRPEQAIAALIATRQPNLPASLVSERRILEANALIKLGRFDHAVELVEKDQSAAAQRVRIDAAWRRKDWAAAAEALVKLLAVEAPPSERLDAEDRDAVLRLAVARVFADDRAGLAALRRAYAARLEGSPEGDAFEVITGNPDLTDATLMDAARRVARTELLDRFLAGMRARLSGRDVGAAPPEAPAATAPPAG